MRERATLIIIQETRGIYSSGMHTLLPQFYKTKVSFQHCFGSLELFILKVGGNGMVMCGSLVEVRFPL